MRCVSLRSNLSSSRLPQQCLPLWSRAGNALTLQTLVVGLAILATTPALSQTYSPWGEAPFWERPSPRSEPNREYQRSARPRDTEIIARGERVDTAAREPDPDELIEARPAGMPLMAIVSLSNQRVTIYDADGPILHASVSSGRTGYETPVGIYSVLQKEAEHYSNRYDDAAMPFMQRITWSGIALHAGALPGYPASHGCVRLPYGFAEHLFNMTKLGMRVIVARDEVAPAPVSHPLLFKPKPMKSVVALNLYRETAEQPASSVDDSNRMQLGVAASQHGEGSALSNQLATLKTIAEAKSVEADVAQKKAKEANLESARKAAEAARPAKALHAAENAKAEAEAALKDAERALQTATSPASIQRAEDRKATAAAELAKRQARLDAARNEDQPKIDEATRAAETAKAAEAAKAAALDAAREAKRKLWPVSVFVSLKTQRLYVRQALEPVFESPITVRDPDKPIGTYIFTALDYTNDGADVRWSVVSLGGKLQPSKGDRRRNDDRNIEPLSTDLSAATATLDRVMIPQDVIDRISEVVLPGSSLIISDEDIGNETGPATDFIILKSGEPQGGLKNRPRNSEPAYRYDRRYRSSPWGGPFFGWW